mmetsp:Transcript_9420/g.20841  ORF Transcript_9420/g.20841 Transcript_9420/m.20841 type:complete len:207 (-) Transcript_9420:225-845(-)
MASAWATSCRLWATSCSVNSFCTVSSDLRQIKSTLLTTPGSWVTTDCSMRLRSNMFLSQVLVSLSISNSKSIFSRTISSFRRFSRSYSSWICRVCEIKSSRMAIVRFRAAWRSARLPVCARTSAAARAACSFARWWLKPFARASSSAMSAAACAPCSSCSLRPSFTAIPSAATAAAAAASAATPRRTSSTASTSPALAARCSAASE